jgi:hypothetical protein
MQKLNHYTKIPMNFLLILMLSGSLQSCYHYRVLTTKSDPGTEYESKMLWSYAWGLVNNPKDFTVPNCPESTGLDEVRVTQNAGSMLLTLITIGIVAPVKVEWKCHKPAPRPGGHI